MKFSSELLKGVTKNIILASLMGGEKYGYQIAKIVREKTNELIELGEGSLYPALHELEKHEYVKSRWAQVGGRERKYYTLTHRGKKELIQARVEWQSFSQAVDAALSAP